MKQNLFRHTALTEHCKNVKPNIICVVDVGHKTET